MFIQLIWQPLLGRAEGGLHDDGGNLVGIGVGGGTSVLEVTAALGGSFPRNADRGTTVGNTI